MSDDLINLKMCLCCFIVVKREIVDLMLRSPEKLQKQVQTFTLQFPSGGNRIIITNLKLFICVIFFQLSDAVSVIGREDFPDKWEKLLPVCNNNLV